MNAMRDLWSDERLDDLNRTLVQIAAGGFIAVLVGFLGFIATQL